MMKKLPYKILAVSTFLTITTTYAVTPVAAFASEIEQTNNGDMSLSANEEQMKKVLQDAGVFAKSMNEYSYLLMNNPDVSFEGITINGYADLPIKIVQDQKNARAHAVTWNTKVKKQLLDTLTGIIEYDTKFENHYETLVEAINTGNGDTLKKGITDLRGEIQQNQKSAKALIEELTKLKNDIGEDVRAFGSHKETLQSILKNQGADVETDQKRLDEVLGQVNYYKKLESDGLTMVKIPFIPTLISGGIMIGTARDNLGRLEPTLTELRKTVDYKITLNRVVGVAFHNISDMHSTIDNAITALTYMSTQWDDLDSQYSGVLGHIDTAAQKADQNRYKFLNPNLNSAKDSWKTLRTDVVTLQEGMKIAEEKEQDRMNQLRPSNVFYFYKKIHNAYTFEIKTGTNAPNASYKVMNLTKNTVHNMWSGGPNTNMWADWLSFNPKDEFAVVAVVDGKEYVVYKGKVENIMN
ncbi:hemolysin BL regulatory component HblB [Bacillus pseudomycoides]|uniref:Hemolysin BL-binding component n=1 Tax=Bacillus pseudomycoides TaxID=64104 RepID=A0A2B6R7W3_9BACI|nr:HBL/NHE enterotoxin family protein [Bacillus pseudomycoides]PDY43948.1 hemolysin BL-binding component precursor [Bacillus pseudomycoides]PED06076.1 hemolysin BL-binding component precursor [Bacillus pseudomycoides]PED70155.1 hemolysin BL-binding component precursor [Bacillus pseudomycoides]PEI46964.1 hemolysin BL-binding component precursor [Bacillus pseudomycoides]PEI90870.1 hemolysin BL-binding component precursor [Bacillus pseudomycoides]